jgi:hypothetical protein
MTARLGRSRIFCVLPDNRRLARNLILPLLSKHGKRRNRAHHAARLVRGQPACAGEKGRVGRVATGADRAAYSAVLLRNLGADRESTTAPGRAIVRL